MAEPIVIKVTDKVPEIVSGPPYVVCDNSDYTVVWQLDGEWAQFEHRTMQVNYRDGTYERVLFTGDSCTLPAFPVPGPVHVGLFAGDIHTTRPARLLAVRSATTDSGEERDPTPDGYAQAIKALDGKLDKNQGAENAGKALVVDEEGNATPVDARSDWNQNDSTKPDYVKNRTHWAWESVETEIVPETEFAIEDASSNYNVPISSMPSIGDTCTIVFDGETYTQQAKNDGTGIAYVGNFALSNPDGDDTGESFVVAFLPNDYIASFPVAFIKTKTVNTHTITISANIDIVHTLDHKYIKDMYYSELVDVNAGTGSEGWLTATNGAQVTVLYKVVVAGETFENILPTESDSTFVYTLGAHTLTVELSIDAVNLSVTPNDISVDGIVFYYAETAYHPIPDWATPDWVASVNDIVQADWKVSDTNSLAYIKNKPDLSTKLGTFKYGYSVSGVMDTIGFPGSSMKDVPDVVLVRGSNLVNRMGARWFQVGNSSSPTISGPILSCNTGAQITDAEFPYGVMVLVKIDNPGFLRNTLICINPLPISITLGSSTEGSTKKFRVAVDDSGTLSAVEVTDAS